MERIGWSENESKWSKVYLYSTFYDNNLSQSGIKNMVQESQIKNIKSRNITQMPVWIDVSSAAF